MAIIQLKNEHLTLKVSTLGAELQSIKDNDGQEYLWQADPEIWGRHSPILFPIVCGLWEGKYRIDGYEYKMERHGFARDTEFSVIRQSETKVTMAIHDTPETHRVYPCHFNLSVTYRLSGRKIHVIWHVENIDNNEIHFQIGGHPAFYVPGVEPGQPLKGRMRFDDPGTVERVFGDVGGCIRPGRFPLDSRDGIWEFDEESFKNDAVIIDRCQLAEVALLDEDDEPVVTVHFKAPAVGLWSPYGKHAPFVCIEPWYGIHDKAYYQGDFKEKQYMNHLQPGASFMSEYTITIG